MKNIILILSLCVSAFTIAQIEAPQPSPSAKVMQTVGLTDVTLEYSRPAMKGREIFGSLVPYDKMWRTGANENAKITFSDNVEFGGTDVKAGTYAVFTKPGKSQWEVILYSDTNNWGTPKKWDDSKVVAKATVKPMMLNMAQESFTMAINELKMDSAHLEIMWDKTLVAAPFSVPSSEKTMASIEKVMAGPAANDYYSAASFYLDAGMDMKKAHNWISKAVEMQPEAYWMQTKKSLIEEKMGDKKAAIDSAKTALNAAEKAGNADYVKINTDNLKKWGAKM
jgi:hypothetical protein